MKNIFVDVKTTIQNNNKTILNYSKNGKIRRRKSLTMRYLLLLLYNYNHNY